MLIFITDMRVYGHERQLPYAHGSGTRVRLWT